MVMLTTEAGMTTRKAPTVRDSVDSLARPSSAGGRRADHRYFGRDNYPRADRVRAAGAVDREPDDITVVRDLGSGPVRRHLTAAVEAFLRPLVGIPTDPPDQAQRRSS